MTTWKLTGSVIRHDYEIKPGVTASEAIAFMAEEDDIANARLIAAAPQLLEACKAALQRLEQLSTRTYWADNVPVFNESITVGIAAAIAAAEGAQP